jgi:hypothetical protein
VTALPLVTILAMIWLWLDSGDAEQVAAYSRATFWLALPNPAMLLGLAGRPRPRSSVLARPRRC